MIHLIPISFIERGVVAKRKYDGSEGLLGERQFTALHLTASCSDPVVAVPYAITIEALPIEERCDFYLVAAQIRGSEQMQTGWSLRHFDRYGSGDEGWEQLARSPWALPPRDHEKHLGRSVLDPRVNDNRALRLHWDAFSAYDSGMVLYVWTEHPCSLIVTIYGDFATVRRTCPGVP